MAKEIAGAVPDARRGISLTLMPSFHTFRYLKNYLSHLNPDEVRKMSDLPITVGLVASNSEGFLDMEDWLVPPDVSEVKRTKATRLIHRAGEPNGPARYDLMIYEQGLPCPANAFTFYRSAPEATVQEIVEQRNDITVALSANFLPFRRAVTADIISRVARENALFSVATSIPYLVPLLGLGFAAGELASDTVFLTINQIRMSFLLAAASDKSVGYSQQKGEIASIIASAFGWRALARQLVGKIPFAAGVIPKGAIAYAGTFVIGSGIERLYSLGSGLSRVERRHAYQEAYERGTSMMERVVGTFGRTNPA
jgi:hypothetical protein